jgi:hypothetical protein
LVVCALFDHELLPVRAGGSGQNQKQSEQRKDRNY